MHYKLFNILVYIILFQCLQGNREMTEREQGVFPPLGESLMGQLSVLGVQLGSNRKSLNHHRSIPSVRSAKGCRGL